MAEKIMKTRIVHKHDTEANWNLATNFTPKQGEIIVYDKDATYDYARFKIGDGATNVNSLPFAAVEVLTVVVTQNDDDSFSADKTYAEIIEAINQHKVVQIADMNKNVVPLSWWENEDLGFTMTYGYENYGVAGALRHYIGSYEWVIRSDGEVWRRAYEVSNVTNEDIVSIANEQINASKPKFTTLTLLAANWTGSNSPWSQVVTINGVTANSKVDLQPTVVQLTELQSLNVVFMAENDDGVVTIYAMNNKPTSDYTIQVIITEMEEVGA